MANGASNGPGRAAPGAGYQGNQGYNGYQGNQGNQGPQNFQDRNEYPGQQAYPASHDAGSRYGYQSQDNQAAAAAAMAHPLTNFPSDHLGARDRGARRFAVRPSAGIGEAPVGEIGRVIFAIVQEQPGIHFRGLARAANLTSAGQLRHHLDRLERHGLVVELEDGRYKRFFAAGDHEPELRPGLARFSRMVPRRIGKLLLAGPMNRTELRRSLGCADSTLGYHLNRMLRSGDLQKQRTPTGCNYALADEAFVRRLLQQPDGRPMPGPGGQVAQQVPVQQDPYGWNEPHPAVDGVGQARPPRPAPAPSSPAPDGFDDMMPGPV
jgi:DNA-binding transcriptional ArsR family regulator